MIDLTKLLENFEDGRDVLVCLSFGDEFILYDFEMVDESIYDRNDIVLATIRKVLMSKFKYRCETMIELDLTDIVSLSDPNTKHVFYKKPNKNSE